MKTKASEILLALLGTSIFISIVIPFFYIWIPNKILLSPEHIFLFDMGAFRYIGLLPIVIGVIIFIYCACSFILIGKGTPIPFTPTKALIITGLYRFVRNPMYISGILILAGEALVFQSIGIFIFCVVMFGMFHVMVLMEETLLSEKFGAAYDHYRDAVPRWVPRLKPYQGHA
jgi:protein-S-isoprenylcysteine O-methyltransferase Ste14